MTTSVASSGWHRFLSLQEWPDTAVAEIVSTPSRTLSDRDDPYQLMRSLSATCGWSAHTGSGPQPEFARSPLWDLSDGSAELTADDSAKVFLQATTYAPAAAVTPAFLWGVGDVVRHMGLAPSSMLLQLPAGTTAKSLMAAMAQLVWTRPGDQTSISVEVNEISNRAEVSDLVTAGYQRASALAIPAFAELRQSGETAVSFQNVELDVACAGSLIVFWTAVLAEVAGDDLDSMRLSIHWA